VFGLVSSAGQPIKIFPSTIVDCWLTGFRSIARDCANMSESVEYFSDDNISLTSTQQSEDGNGEYEVERILAEHQSPNEKFYLIYWKGMIFNLMIILP
jgi:hypothetical protein